MTWNELADKPGVVCQLAGTPFPGHTPESQHFKQFRTLPSLVTICYNLCLFIIGLGERKGPPGGPISL